MKFRIFEFSAAVLAAGITLLMMGMLDSGVPGEAYDMMSDKPLD